MANPTVLDFKTAVSAQLGKSNANVQVPKRDEACKSAIREYVNESAWRWNRSTATVTVTGGYGTLPATFSSLFEPTVYSYSGTTRTTYEQCDLDAIQSFPSSLPRYAVDEENGRLYCSQNVIVTVSFQKAPPTLLLNGTDDAVSLPFPDISTPKQLAIGYYWKAAERNDDEFKAFIDESFVSYRTKLRKDIRRNRASGPNVYPGSPLRGRDLGWNVRGGW